MPTSIEIQMDIDDNPGIIKANPTQIQQVIINGHTDNLGRRKYNRGLSARRANAVSGYLEAKGVPKGKFSIRSFGESRPRARNNSNSNRALNRRVEIELRK